MLQRREDFPWVHVVRETARIEQERRIAARAPPFPVERWARN